MSVKMSCVDCKKQETCKYEIASFMYGCFEPKEPPKQEKSCESCYTLCGIRKEDCLSANRSMWSKAPKQDKSCSTCKTKCDIRNSVKKITNTCKYWTGGEMADKSVYAHPSRKGEDKGENPVSATTKQDTREWYEEQRYEIVSTLKYHNEEGEDIFEEVEQLEALDLAEGRRQGLERAKEMIEGRAFILGELSKTDLLSAIQKEIEEKGK